MTQSTVDHVISARVNLEKLEEGYISPTIGGGVSFQPADPSVLARREAIVTTTLDLLTGENNIRCIGDSQDEQGSRRKELTSAIGKEPADDVVEAKARSVHLVAIDWSIRGLAAQAGVETIGIQLRSLALRIHGWAQKRISHLNVIAMIGLKEAVEHWLSSQ
ncbi:hypothetical protein [Marispirochaeta aestuarii]|uniref:hypothetical protein n=1 Tax=Marispirochaeta aestuarii TaxID=1963862 RepID=UPI0029C8C618|nr:hypothetical protein [Marispirochaeta aestuarii]